MKQLIFLFVIIFVKSVVAQSQDLNLKDTRAEEISKRATHLGHIDEHTKIYLRGSINEWGVTDAFTRISDGIYVIENYILFNGRDGLKIATEDWQTVDLGGFGTNFKINQPNKMKVGGENIFIDGIIGQQAVRLQKITLDLNQMTILFEKSDKKYPHISLNYPTDTEFMSDEFIIVPHFNLDVAEGVIKILGKNNIKTVVVKNNDEVKIGSDEPFDTELKVVTLAMASDGVVMTDTTTFLKSTPTSVYVYFNNVAKWDKPYCYLWNLRGDRNLPWPGEPMQWDDNIVINGQKGWWKIQVSNRYAEYGEVIFNNNASLQTNDDLSMEGVSMYFDGKNWKKLE